MTKNYDVVYRLAWSARDISSSWQVSTLTPASYNFPPWNQTSEFNVLNFWQLSELYSFDFSLCTHCWNFVYLCPLCCEFQIVLSHIIAAICRQRNIWQWKICWPDKRMLQSTWTTSNTEEPTSAPTGWSTWTNQRWYSYRLSYTNLIILEQLSSRIIKINISQ